MCRAGPVWALRWLVHGLAGAGSRTSTAVGDYHAVNVACYLLRHPSQSRADVLAGQWRIIDAFLFGGLQAVTALTARAVRHNRGRVRRPSLTPDWPPQARTVDGFVSMTIEDVSVDGTFPAHGYDDRIAEWALAVAYPRGPQA
ncbi:DUF5946 family protein [Hoyosella sp. YIM 151337]|uniref:DUF5946 family protein n=1 Tax=Hoyosella sp. YIM 151337 TaxID=2992742 RepID=UPI00223670F1|nr:DUF5946 family protein [Hoyosella sp. YIM 151337]MCW4352057.1 DUF5946 family protein [Hoyosella sp. YIM 151337]